jgi:hypothetical protein
MTQEIEETRRKVARYVLEHLEKANSRTKQEMISKLIAKLPDEHVIALDFAYDFYKTGKEDKPQ